jgi:hypothetical protein
LVRKVTWTEDVRAISVLGDVMVDTSAANVPGDVINDANAVTVPEKTSGDSRRVSRLEDVIGGASPIAVLGAMLRSASGASVPGDVIDGASSVSVWKNKLDSTRAAAVLEDVIDGASGESLLGYVTWTGGTSSVPLMGDVLDSDSATVVPVPGDVSDVVDVVSVIMMGIMIAGTKAASVMRNVDGGAATRFGLEDVFWLGDMIDSAGAVPVCGCAFGSWSVICVMGDVIGDDSGRSVLGNALHANAVPVAENVIRSLNITMSVQTYKADDASAVSELGDVIDGASAVAAFENEPCSVKGISKLGGVTNDANGVTLSVLAFMFGGKSAVSELAIAAFESGLKDVIGGTTTVSLLGVMIGNESVMAELWDVFCGIGGMSAVSAVTLPGVVINNANAMSDLVHANCCRAIAVSVHLSRISQSIPPFYADGYTASESVPESTGSVSTSHDSESEVVRPVQKQRGQHQPNVYTMSKNQMTRLVPGVSTGLAGPEQDRSGQVETISVQSISAVSKSVYAGRGSSGSVFDDPFAVLTWSMSEGSLICQCHQNQPECQCKPRLYPLSVCQRERGSEAKSSDPLSTLITVAPGGSYSFCCSKCLVSAGPTRTTGLQVSRLSSEKSPWQQALSTISWLDCSSVWMLKMVLLLFLLYLSWLYVISYSTTTHSLKTCSFSLHRNTISPSMIRSQ